jgi:cytochrome P450
MTHAPVTLDLNDLDVFASGRHHAVFDWLREHDPVHWQEPAGNTPGFWSLTRYHDIVRVYNEHVPFSSAYGVMLGGSFRNEVDTAANRMLVASDPPRQRLLRQAMHAVFAPHIGERVTRQVGELVDAALARAASDGGCDFATDVAPELPAGALMAVVGIPYPDARHLVSLTHQMIGFRDPALVPADGDDRLRLVGIQADIFEFFEDLIAERRADPGDDLIGILLRAEVNGRPLPEEDILYNCLNVAVGGNETTPYSACGGLLELMRAPAEYRLLRQRPELADGAVAEVLRLSSVNAYTHRVARVDQQIGGRTVTAGQSLALWNVAANRDPAVFADPHRLDLRRTPNRHIAFGSGIHRCIGAQFGVGELTALVRRLAEGQVRFEPDGEPVRLRSNFMLGFSSLPVRAVGR